MELVGKPGKSSPKDHNWTTPALCLNHRVHRVAMYTFWRTFHREGKISPSRTKLYVVYAPAERADTLPQFLLYSSIYSVVVMQRYQNAGGTKLRSCLRFRYRSETNLLIPELVKIEAKRFKRTLLILHLRKVKAKRILFIPQIWKFEAERTLFIPQIGKSEAKRSLFIARIRKIEAERTLFFPQIRKIVAERTRLIPEIGKIEAKKTKWIEARLRSSCYGAKELIPVNQFR